MPSKVKSKTPAWTMGSPGDGSPVKKGAKKKGEVTRNRQHDAIPKHKGKTVQGITEVSKQELIEEVEAQRGESLMGRACCLVKDAAVAYYHNMGRIAYYSAALLPASLGAPVIAGGVEAGLSYIPGVAGALSRVGFVPGFANAIRVGTAAAIGSDLSNSYDRHVRQELTSEEYTAYVHADAAEAINNASLPTGGGKKHKDDVDFPGIDSPQSEPVKRSTRKGKRHTS